MASYCVSFTALLITAYSFRISLIDIGKKHLVRLQFEKLYPLFQAATKKKKEENESKEAKHLLLPLVAMKMENQRMSLRGLYKLEKELFDKDEILDFFQVRGK